MRPGQHTHASADAEVWGGPVPGGVLDPRALWLMVRRHLRLVGAVLCSALLCGAAVIALTPARYTATAVLLVDPRQQRIVQSEAVLPGIGNDVAAVDSQVEVLQSTTLARRVIEDLRLDGLPADGGSTLGRILADLRSAVRGRRTDGSEEAKRRLLKRFEADLGVRRRGQTYVIEVSFSSGDPDRSAEVANALVRLYMRQQVAIKGDAAREASEWLAERLKDLRSQVDAADRAVASYKAAHGIVETGDQGGQRRTLLDQRLADLNAQLVQARVRAQDAQSRYDRVKDASRGALGNGDLPEALQSPVILALRSQLAGTARSVAEMARVYGPRHPAMQTGQAEVDEIRRQIASELVRLASGLRNELEAARAREAAISADLAALETRAADTDRDAVGLRDLQREAEAARTVLQQSLLRQREAAEQQGLQVPDARVLSPAAAPLAASSPNAPVLLGLSGVVGLCLGLCAAVVVDRRSPVVRTAREAEDLLALPVLASLPAVAPAAGAGRVGRPGEARHRIDRLALDQPLSRFGGAVRDLALRLRGALDAEAKVLVVASAVAGDGASTVAGNVARAMARGGAATLLVQADARQASGAGALPGLQDALRDGTAPTALLRREPESGLAILPAGRVDDPGRGSVLLSGRGMGLALDALRPGFDRIVVDATPLLSSVDGRAMLDLADAALLVVAWDGTRRADLATALRSVDANAHKFLGVVLNAVDPALCAERDDASGRRPVHAAA